MKLLVLLSVILALVAPTVVADAKRTTVLQAKTASASGRPAKWFPWQRTTSAEIVVRYGRESGARPVWHWQFMNTSDQPMRVHYTHNTSSQVRPKAATDVPAKGIGKDLFDKALDGKLKPDVKIERAVVIGTTTKKTP